MAAKSIPCVIMRGGTSKGVFFREKDLPIRRRERDRAILKIFGSPDPTQTDGLGGSRSHTSKAMIVSASKRPGSQIDYTFGQVLVKRPLVDYGGNCGNLTSAVAPFAIDEGMVEGSEPFTVVPLFNTNTGKQVIARVPVKDGRVVEEGPYSISGVPGSGARIDLTFLDPGGSVTGSALPTGHLKDRIRTNNSEFVCSILDVSNPVVFVKANDLGLSGTELPEELNSDLALLEELEAIRCSAAEMIGIVKVAKEATETSPGIPKIALVAAAQDYHDSSGCYISREDVDVVARMLSVGKVHHSYALTGAMCTAAAAKLDDTVVSEIIENPGKEQITVGHPRGTIGAKIKTGKGGRLERITVNRTARRLMKGLAYYLD